MFRYPRQEEIDHLVQEAAKLQKKKRQFEILSKQWEGKDPNIVVKAYIDRLKPLCEQGGYGHGFSYSFPELRLSAPHHWVVKPEHYEASKPTKEEQLAIQFKGFYPGFYCSVKTVAATEHWGN
jgi:hypothetical protein